MDMWKFQYRRMAEGRWSTAIFVATALSFIWSEQSLAAGSCTFSGAGSETFTFPSPISVPRDNAASMTPLSGWVTGAAVTNLYACTSNNGTRVGIGIKFPTLAQAGTYSEGGLNYKVFNTNVPGIGIVYGFRLYATGPYCGQQGGLNGWSGWLAASGNPYSSADCYSDNATVTNSSFGAQMQVRLIKTGKVAAGTMPSFTLNYTAQDIDGAFSTSVGSKNYLINPVSFQALGCTAEGADVILDTARKADFASATSIRTKPFQFTLRNCPAGMNSIKYQLDPIGTIISATDGTFQNASGTDMAKGVGLRITNETNTAPIRFGDSSYVVSNYNTASGSSSLPIKMNVSYYRTGTAAQVTGGKVRGTAQLTLFYL
ncbi:fimbrial protein [Pseudomonas sp. Pseusp97]|uniref:fimbrial protein n=1 Tax=Pseudomonas sp. Pseusp97 TaxID=3243065 RepID=UPI0039A61B53